MKIIGVDPGTKSYDFFGKDDDTVFADFSLPSPGVERDPGLILRALKKEMPLDLIVGPSGYGLPLKTIADTAKDELALMLPSESGEGQANSGMMNVFHLMKKEGLPVCFTPGVIHLPTVPYYRKVNKIDMGSAGKVCCVACGIRDQAERQRIPYTKTCFILVEVGHGFTTVIGVLKGRIVDGIGGTEGGPGFLSPGGMDAELAIRFGAKPRSVLFTGGAKDASIHERISPERMAANPLDFEDSWLMLIEGLVKDVAAISIAVPRVEEILLSGRLARVPGIHEELENRLAYLAPVRLVHREARVAKEAAEGAWILGNGILGGKYEGIVESLQIRQSHGTIYDYISCDVGDEIRARLP